MQHLSSLEMKLMHVAWGLETGRITLLTYFLTLAKDG